MCGRIEGVPVYNLRYAHLKYNSTICALKCGVVCVCVVCVCVCVGLCVFSYLHGCFSIINNLFKKFKEIGLIKNI